uniref:Putative conserved plasma membrane protein n=1 Tax=Corethrella appendiculata TaxID=1370023 RepID=U5ENT7_9DIPT
MPSARKEKFFGAWNRSESTGSMYLSNNNTADNLMKLISNTAPSSPRWTPYNSRHNSPPSPASPLSTSPPATSPYSTLKRNYSSTFTLIPEDRAVDIKSTTITSNNNLRRNPQHYQVSNLRILVRLILWWPLLIIAIFQRLTSCVTRLAWGMVSVTAPTFWISAFLWIFWKVMALPLTFLKWILVTLNTPVLERNRKKRTILISCGSTIQTLHLARNFHKSGARVVVFEFEGLFGLARFSTAVNKFYTIERPTMETANDYISALCEIVEKEKPTHYIPVCATSTSYYDSLVKPHLELLGCSTFCPGAQETCIFDDILQIIKKCEQNEMPIIPHQVLTSKDDLIRLYENGWLSGHRNVMQSCGFSGILERHKFVLPPLLRELKLNHEISEDQKWVVLRDVPGTHYVTCTTIKDSKVIANVTCAIQQETRSLIPEHNESVEKWLNDFFTKVRLHRPINGHISFCFIKCKATGNILPFNVRICVSLPYICYTNVHSKVICKPCPHFSRKNSGPLVQNGGRYWIHDTIMNTIKKPTVDSITQLIDTVLDKREALFVYWDPLPYCAYYHFQLPYNSFKTFLQKRQQPTHSLTPAPVH